MNLPAYRRLARAYSWTGPGALWAAEDHLLLAHSVGWAEVYKRFFLNDIQAIVVRKTVVGAIWNGLWGGLALFFGLIAIQLMSVAGPWIWTMPGVFALGLLVNTASGPTCDCQIQTAVQAERITALKRLRVARRTLQRIRPLLAAAQGELPREQMEIELAGVQPSLGAVPPPAA